MLHIQLTRYTGRHRAGWLAFRTTGRFVRSLMSLSVVASVLVSTAVIAAGRDNDQRDAASSEPSTLATYARRIVALEVQPDLSSLSSAAARPLGVSEPKQWPDLDVGEIETGKGLLSTDTYGDRETTATNSETIAPPPTQAVEGAMASSRAPAVPVSGYGLTWSADVEAYEAGAPLTSGVTIPVGYFYVFLSPQNASSVVWETEGGRTYVDTEYPWRERVKLSELGKGEHTITATTSSGVKVSVPFTFGVNSVPAVPSTTTTVAAVTGVAAPSTTVPAPTTTTAAAVVTTTTAAPKSAAAAPAPVPTVLGGVAVFAGDSIQAAVNANPAGAKFVIKSGVHRRQSVQPKDGNVFVGEPGAVLTGENVTEFAFYGSGDNVTITGLVVEKYNNPQQTGAIYSSKGAAGWIVDGNEIRYNNGIGLKAGSGWKVLNNYVHHNTQLGLGGSGSNILVQGNEIAYNNYQKTVNPFWGGGGTKWVKTRNLVVRGNFSHHNHGPGLWTDIDNDGVLYEGNRVEDNYHAGIKHEISYSAVIRNNTLKRNGFGNPNDVKGAGILVANSPNVEVYGNTLVGNSHGIGAVQHDRYGDPADWKSLGEFELKNLYVHDNYIEQPAGQTGFFVAAGPHGDKPLTSWNNRFQNNTYKLGTNPQPFRWQYSLITAAQWKAHGQDTTGTFQ